MALFPVISIDPYLLKTTPFPSHAGTVPERLNRSSSILAQRLSYTVLEGNSGISKNKGTPY